jgi:hypothetical protein
MGRRFKPEPKAGRSLVAVVCATALLTGNTVFPVRAAPPVSATDVVKIPPDQLDSLVAPLALYPDNLLSQTLVASTYPLEIIQLQQWLDRHQDLATDQQKLADAVKLQQWDPSIQAMAALPDVVRRLADDIQWTTDLGNAFLAQQSDVMDAIQRMRKKAQEKGSLKSNEQQRVETQVVRLWTSDLPVSGNLLSAVLRSLVCGWRDRFWSRHNDGFFLGRRLGLGLWLGRR